MKLIFAFTLLVFASSCTNSGEEKKEDKKTSEIELLEAELSKTDSLILLTKDLSIEIQESYNSVNVIANRQMKADDLIRLKLKETENKSKLLIHEIIEKSTTELKKHSLKVNQYLDSTLLYFSKLKEFLPDFASYDNAINVFSARVLTDIDGQIPMNIEKLLKEIDYLEKRLIQEKQRLMIRLEKTKS
jgi:hypothetical protein